MHTRALHRCFVSMRRACCAARSPRVRTRAHAMLTAARPRAPADNLPSVESNSPFARTRVADERVACEAMAAVGGAHAALVYLAAEGRAGGYVSLEEQPRRPRDSTQSLAPHSPAVPLQPGRTYAAPGLARPNALVACTRVSSAPARVRPHAQPIRRTDRFRTRLRRLRTHATRSVLE